MGSSAGSKRPKLAFEVLPSKAKIEASPDSTRSVFGSKKGNPVLAWEAGWDYRRPVDVMRDIVAAVPAYGIARAGERAAWW